MLRLKWLAAVSATGSLALAGVVHADDVLLKNGDHITGKIVTATAGQITILPDFAPHTQILLSQADVATFSTSDTAVLKLKDGTTITQPVQQGEAGQVQVASGGAQPTQSVDLAQVDQINPPPPPPVAWHGAFGVNGLYSNASITSMLIGASASGTRQTDHDLLTLHGGYDYGEQTANNQSTTNANDWSAGGKYSRFLSTRVYDYVGIEAAGDQVNFLNLRFAPSVGAGYRWFNRPDFHLTTDAGLAWIYMDYSTDPKASESWAGSLSYHVDKAWADGRFSLFHDFQFLPEFQTSRTLMVADAGLRSNLTKTMYSEIRLDVTHDSQPAPGAKDTTSQVKLGLGWTY